MRTLLRSIGRNVRFFRENVSYSCSSIDHRPKIRRTPSAQVRAYEKPDLPAGRPDHLG
jgi:hypothetical protein